MKKKEHDDMMDLFNFIFGEPIGKVDDMLASNTVDFPKQIKIDVSELEEIQCKACKAKFQPNTEFHYVAKSRRLIAEFSDVTELVLHDAYDCPLCGAQIILGERLERLK